MTKTATIKLETIEIALNQLVASKIMGIVWLDSPRKLNGNYWENCYARPITDSWEVSDTLPDYVHNMDEASQLVRQVHAIIDAPDFPVELRATHLTLSFGGGSEDAWFASFSQEAHQTTDAQAPWISHWYDFNYSFNNASLPLAICKAALELIEALETYRQNTGK